MKIVGLTSHQSGNHDSSVAIINNGKVIYAEAEERLSRIKHDRSLPKNALEEGLKIAKITRRDVDYYASATPLTSFPKMLTSYFKGASFSGYPEFFRWISGRFLYYFKEAKGELQTLSNLKLSEKKLIIVPHHDAHAATAYWYGPFDRCLIVVLDGYGADLDGTPLAGKVYRSEDNEFEEVEKVPCYTSWGLYYGAVTVALGFKLNDGEGKTMGLAVYGDPKPCYQQMKKFFPAFDRGKWCGNKWWLDVNTVSRKEFFAKTKANIYLRKLIERYGDKNVAAAAQKVLEEEGLKFILYLKRKYSLDKFSFSGGVFLNIKLTLKIMENVGFENVWVYPNPGDSGVALGAALLAYKQKGGKLVREELFQANFGCEYSTSEIANALKLYKDKLVIEKIDSEKIAINIAKKIASGKVIGWYQGRCEWGPRALGQRSVMADPRDAKIKKRINDIMKKRDWFMPFACSMLEEKAGDYFPNLKKAPFMIMADNVKRGVRKNIKAAIHIDGTCRPQFVSKSINPLYWKTIYEFSKLTKVPAVLNTSFNKHGLPLVHSPKDAIDHLLWGCVDELMIGNFLVTRNEK